MNCLYPAAGGKVLWVGFQLGLLILIIELFELQSATFLNLPRSVFFGFLKTSPDIS